MNKSTSPIVNTLTCITYIEEKNISSDNRLYHGVPVNCIRGDGYYRTVQPFDKIDEPKLTDDELQMLRAEMLKLCMICDSDEINANAYLRLVDKALKDYLNLRKFVRNRLTEKEQEDTS